MRPGPPLHESIPRQALAMAGWILLWLAAERLLAGQGLGPRGQLAVLLGSLAGLGGLTVLLGRRWLFLLFTSIRFAVTQGCFLAAAVLAGTLAARDVFHRLWFTSLLAVLAASMLTVTWKRRPYTPARLGFLLVHVAPALVLTGLLWGRLAGVRAEVRLSPGVAVATLPGFRFRLERREGIRSELVILDDQQLERARKVISPGDPLVFRGYGFYQGATDPGDPTGSAIRVVRQPGLWLVGAGYASLLVGCVWMFYLKPGLKRREAAKGKRP
jgi:hypothetical protein